MDDLVTGGDTTTFELPSLAFMNVLHSECTHHMSIKRHRGARTPIRTRDHM